MLSSFHIYIFISLLYYILLLLITT